MFAKENVTITSVGGDGGDGQNGGHGHVGKPAYPSTRPWDWPHWAKTNWKDWALWGGVPLGDLYYSLDGEVVLNSVGTPHQKGDCIDYGNTCLKRCSCIRRCSNKCRWWRKMKDVPGFSENKGHLEIILRHSPTTEYMHWQQTNEQCETTTRKSESVMNGLNGGRGGN